MGVDLTVGIDRRPIRWHLLYERVKFNRDRALWDAIRALPSYPCPAGETVEWYDDDGYKPITEDNYGKELRFIRHGSLWALLRNAELMEDIDAENHALIVFLRSLCPETMLWLYWH